MHGQQNIKKYLKNVQDYNAVAFYANLKHANVKYCDTKILPTVHYTLKKFRIMRNQNIRQQEAFNMTL